jgi:hypothetical protein
MDGEAMLLGVDGISNFDALHSRQHDDVVGHSFIGPFNGANHPVTTCG